MTDGWFKFSHLTMDKTNLHIWIKEIAKKTGFVLGKEIYQGEYYSPDRIRNLIFEGQYQNKTAVLKVYDDPRLTDEPVAQDTFNKKNKSKILRAPEVYNYEITSPKKGWLIMEKLPENGYFLKQPLDPKERKQFLELYLEYRKNSPSKPTRVLTLAENLPAHEFHTFRISRWFQLATDKEAELVMSGQKPILKPKKFIPRFEKGLTLIRQEFKRRKMVWCHGHFKPHEIFKVSERGIYYLTDFAHSKMYPEGYEFGFIIWADWIMSANWRMTYPQWKKGIDEWLAEFQWLAKKLKIKRFQSLMKASLVERSLGTILADICATDRPAEEKRKRISLLYQFLDELT
jgi:hypothetical protein